MQERGLPLALEHSRYGAWSPHPNPGPRGQSVGLHSDLGYRVRGPHTDLRTQQRRARGPILSSRGAEARSVGSTLRPEGLQRDRARVYALTQAVEVRTQGPH